jgi:hypothetical protein
MPETLLRRSMSVGPPIPARRKPEFSADLQRDTRIRLRWADLLAVGIALLWVKF